MVDRVTAATRTSAWPVSVTRRRLAVLAIAASVIARLIWVFAGPHNFNFVDLRVYYEAAHRVLSGGLYDFALSEYTPRQPLPFTYPPFAAIVFVPLRVVPFPVVAIGWLVLTVALLYLVIAMSLAMLRAARGLSPCLADVPREQVLLWTAGVLWLDPVRTNLDYGQVNVVLMTLGTWAAYVTVRYRPRGARPAWSDGVAGALVGIAAGIKLTPAVGGLFLVARKRYWAAVASAVVFVGTVGVGYLILPAESHRYFTVLIGDTGPIGDPAKPDNQSLRGVLSRFAGHDLATGPTVIVGMIVAAALIGAAWWICRRGDALIVLVLAQSLGLAVSPISWIHHWVWLVPTLVWLVQGPLGATWPARTVAVAYAAYSYVGVHGVCAVLGWLHIESGPVWALALCPGILATLALVAVILFGHRTIADHADRSAQPTAGGAGAGSSPNSARNATSRGSGRPWNHPCE